MRTEQKVQYLTYLDVQVFENQLMLIRATGYSKNEPPGVPKLMPPAEADKNAVQEILELDFINQEVGDSIKEKVTFDINIVIDRSKLPESIKGVKVIAGNNADIVLF